MRYHQPDYFWTKSDPNLMKVTFLEDSCKFNHVKEKLKDLYGITIAQQFDTKFRSKNHFQNLKVDRTAVNRALNSKIEKNLLQDLGNAATDPNENDLVRELYDTIKDIKIQPEEIHNAENENTESSEDELKPIEFDKNLHTQMLNQIPKNDSLAKLYAIMIDENNNAFEQQLDHDILQKRENTKYF